MTARAAATMSSGSLMRPGPESLPVRWPDSGPTKWKPRERRVSTFATVAAFCHISVCIAGATTSGYTLTKKEAGKRIAVGRGSTNEAELMKIAPPTAQIVRYDDDATGSTAIISGQADAFATAPSLFLRINQLAPAKQMETKIVMQANMLGIGLRKNEPALKARIDAFVKANLKSGELNTIYKKYHGTDLTPEVLKNAE